MNHRQLLAIAAAAAALLLSACSGPPRKVYLNRDVVTVAVIPPFNEDIDIEASQKMRPHVESWVRARGYQVLPSTSVDAFYQEKGFSLPEEISQYTAREIADALGVQGLLLTTILRYGSQVELLKTTVGVEAKFELIEGQSEEVLWWATGRSVKKRSTLSIEGAIRAGAVLLEDADKYCGGACRAGLRNLPWAGFDPAVQRAPAPAETAPTEGEAAPTEGEAAPTEGSE